MSRKSYGSGKFGIKFNTPTYEEPKKKTREVGSKKFKTQPVGNEKENFRKKIGPSVIRKLESSQHRVEKFLKKKEPENILSNAIKGIAGGLKGILKKIVFSQNREEEKDNLKSIPIPRKKIRGIPGFMPPDRYSLGNSELIDLETGKPLKKKRREVDMSYYNEEKYFLNPSDEVYSMSQPVPVAMDEEAPEIRDVRKYMNKSCYPAILNDEGEEDKLPKRSMNVRRMLTFQINSYEAIARSRADSISQIKKNLENCVKPRFARNKGFNLVDRDCEEEEILEKLRESMFEDSNKYHYLKKNTGFEEDEMEKIFRKKKKRGKGNYDKRKKNRWRRSQALKIEKRRISKRLSQTSESQMSDDSFKRLETELGMSNLFSQLDHPSRSGSEKKKRYSKILKDACTSVRKIEKSIQTSDIKQSDYYVMDKGSSIKTATFGGEGSLRNTIAENLKNDKNETKNKALRQTIGVVMRSKNNGIFDNEKDLNEKKECGIITEVNEKKEEEEKTHVLDGNEKIVGNVFFNVDKEGEKISTGNSLFFNNNSTEENNKEPKDDDKNKIAENEKKEDEKGEKKSEEGEKIEKESKEETNEEVKLKPEESLQKKPEVENKENQNDKSTKKKSSPEENSKEENNFFSIQLGDEKKEEEKNQEQSDEPTPLKKENQDSKEQDNPFIKFDGKPRSFFDSIKESNDENESNTNNMFNKKSLKKSTEKNNSKVFFGNDSKEKPRNPESRKNTLMSLINKTGKSTMFEEESSGRKDKKEFGGRTIFGERGDSDKKKRKTGGIFSDFNNDSPKRGNIFGERSPRKGGMFDDSDSGKKWKKERGGMFDNRGSDSGKKRNRFLEDRDRGGENSIFGEERRRDKKSFFETDDRNDRNDRRLGDRDRGRVENPFSNFSSGRDKEVSFGGYSGRGGSSNNPFLEANQGGRSGRGGLFDTNGESGFGGDDSRRGKRKIKRIIRPDTGNNRRLFD